MLEIWVIYDHPIDFPNEFVARKFILDKPTKDMIVMPSLDEVRKMLPPDLTRLDRCLEDDPRMIEVWL